MGGGIECLFEHGDNIRTTITFAERSRIRMTDAREEIEWLETRLRAPRASMFNPRDKMLERHLKLENRCFDKELLIREAGPYSSFGAVPHDVRHMICKYAGLTGPERYRR